MANELLVVGKRVPRHSSGNKVTGQLKYHSDIRPSNVLHMKVKGSPYANANIVSIDTSKAEALTGVVAVITYQNVPQVPLSSLDNMCTLNNRSCFVGCEIAAVAAVNEEIAQLAVELIEVQYDIKTPIVTTEEALNSNANLVHPGTSNLLFGEPIVVEWGDVSTGFDISDHIVEGNYSSQAQYNCALENHGSVAQWDTDDNLTIWTGTQSAFDWNRSTIAKGCELPVHKVRVIQTHCGGSFGNKDRSQLRTYCMAALLSKKTQKPVKFVGTKEDEFIRWSTRHPMDFKIKMGLSNDGTINAVQMDVLSNTGAYLSDASIGTLFVAMENITYLYKIPNFLFKGKVVFSNKPNAGALRGWGTPQGFMAFEQLLDQAAEKANLDPMGLRRHNMTKAGDIVGAGVTLGSCGIDECIDKGALAIEWQDKWKGFGQSFSVNGTKRKAIGMAACMHPGSWHTASDIVKIMEDGTVQLLTGAADIGQGSDTVLRQICAEAIGVTYESVAIVSADTAVTPWTAGSYSSGRTTCSGNSVKLAAESALEKLLHRASALTGTAFENLFSQNGFVVNKKDLTEKTSFADIMATFTPPVIIGTGEWVTPTEYAIKGYAAQFAEVEVDIETGNVNVSKMVLAHDVGKAINPTTVENQIEGGVASIGIGFGLLEDPAFDSSTGIPLNVNYLDYRIPTILDIPEMETILIESIEPRGPYGAKGAGEIAMVPTAPAIANAIYNAIGVRITEYPITPDKILKELGKI